MGLGPGSRDLLTPRALNAIDQADIIIGYKTYVDLIADLLDHKQVVSSGMRQEIDRARRAIEEAAQGRTVAVISGGDPGVYGMAGIILEMAGSHIKVEIVPGVTAATAAAAILGAPLMHDFAVISLSDLLTPWDKIITRLEAAGLGDYVVILYNPASTERQKQLETAREILLWHKNPATPVGIVRNAERGRQSIAVTTLKDMLEEKIDMLTTIIVGNSETRVENGRMITPRGYII